MTHEQGEESTDFEIPQRLQDAIAEMEESDLELAQEADPDSAEDIVLMATDHRTNVARFLHWFQQTLPTGLTLYPGGASDTLPQAAFGEDQVVYTQVRSDDPDVDSFMPEIGGKQHEVDYSALPFGDGEFQTIFMHRFSNLIRDREIAELERVLREGGTFVLARMHDLMTGIWDIETEHAMIRHYEESPSFEGVEVPEPLQGKGLTGSEFYVFRKKPTQEP